MRRLGGENRDKKHLEEVIMRSNSRMKPEHAKIKEDKIIGSLLTLTIFLFLELSLAALTPPALAMPVPVGGQFFSYDAAASPVAVSDPSIAQPVGLGSVTQAGDKLSIQVGLEAFDGPVDVYFAISAPEIDPNNIYLLTPGNSLQPVSHGLVSWRANVNGPIDEAVFGDIPVSALPPGLYNFYIAITPAGSLNAYYLWQTEMNLFSLTVNKFGTGSATSDIGGIKCGDNCSATFAPGATVSLDATAGADNNFMKWGGCDVSTGNTCSLVMNKDRSVSPMFGTRPELKPNVKVLNENIVQCLAVANNADGSATYSFTLSQCSDQAIELSRLSEGDILDITAGTPAIRKVTAVDSSQQGLVVAETIQGDLSDLASRGTIVFSGRLMPESGVSAASLANGQSKSAQDEQNTNGCTAKDEDCPEPSITECGKDLPTKCPNGDDIGVTFSPTCTITCTGKWFNDLVSGTAKLKLDGSSTLALKILAFAVDWGNKTCIKPADCTENCVCIDTDVGFLGYKLINMDDLLLNVELDQTNDAKISLDAELKANYEKTIYGHTWGPIQCGPYLTLVPVFNLSAGFEADAKASVKTSLHTDASVSFGFSCTAPNAGSHTWDTLGNCQPLGTPVQFNYNLQTPEACGTVDVKGWIKPKFEMRAYDLIGTPVFPFPYARVHAEANTFDDSIAWDLYAGIGLSIGTDLGVLPDNGECTKDSKTCWAWSHDFSPQDLHINSLEWCLAGDCLREKPTSKGPTATITAPSTKPFQTNLNKMPVSFKGSGKEGCSAPGVIGATVSTCSWDFGDGSPKVQANVLNADCQEVTHDYTPKGDGNYTATLTITYSDSKTATDTIVVSINTVPPPPPHNVKITVVKDLSGLVPPGTDISNVTLPVGVAIHKVTWDPPHLSDLSASASHSLVVVPPPITASNPTLDVNFNVYRKAYGKTGTTLYSKSPFQTIERYLKAYVDTFGLNEAKICYQVSSIDKNGNESALTDPKCVEKTLPLTIKPPRSLVVSIPATSIPLTWDEIDGEDLSYQIIRNGSVVKTQTSPPFYDTGLLPGTTNCYKIGVLENGVLLATSGQTCIATSADVTPPTTPTGLTATFDQMSYQINLSWNASTDNVGVAGYRGYVGIDGAGIKYVFSVTGTNAYVLVDSGAAGGHTFCFKASAYDAAGNESAKSAQVCVTPQIGGDTQPPTVPTGLTASATSSSQINLSWTGSMDTVGVTGYKIYRNGATTPLKTASGTSTSDTGLAASTQYCYQVSAYDAAGNESAKSAQACATTQAGADVTPPSIPTGLTASAVSSSQINLSWSASTDNVAVMGYKVYRNGSIAKTISGTGTIDSGLTASTQYCYQVSAFDAAGNESAKSAQACATTSNGTVSCTFTISPTSQNFIAGGGSNTLSVSASGSSCSWTATSNAAWITITSGSSGTGSGTVSYSVSANPGSSSRTGTITAASKAFTVTQDGVACTASSIVASPLSLSFTMAPGQSSTQSVTVKDNCGNDLSYTISSVTYFPIGTEFKGWVSVPSAGTGSLAVTVTDPSLGPGTRSAGVDISSTGLPTYQLPVSLTITCTPTSIVTIPSSITKTASAGQSITLSAQVQNNCGTPISFTAHSTLYPSATTSGTGTLSITLPALPAGTYHDTIVISSGGLPNYSLAATLTVN